MRFLGSLSTALQRLAHPGQKESASPTQYYDWMGWRWNTDQTTLTGRFRTPYCAPKGRLERHPDGTFDLYISDPPKELLASDFPYHRCFPWYEGEKAHHVHFECPASSLTIDGCIQTVERTLVEAFTKRRNP